MSLDNLLAVSIGVNIVQVGAWFRERRLRLREKERFTKYLAKLEKRISVLEKRAAVA